MNSNVQGNEAGDKSRRLIDQTNLPFGSELNAASLSYTRCVDSSSDSLDDKLANGLGNEIESCEMAPENPPLLEHTSDVLQNLAFKLHDWGFNPLPAIGKQPVVLYADNWEEQFTREDIRQFDWKTVTGLSVMIGFGGLRMLDVDGIAEGTDKIKLLDRWIGLLGLPSHYEWCSWSGSGRGFHIYFVTDDPPYGLGHSMKHDRLSLDGSFDHAELRINRMLGTLPPSVHPDTQKEYVWVTGYEPSAAPSELKLDYVSGQYLANVGSPNIKNNRLCLEQMPSGSVVDASGRLVQDIDQSRCDITTKGCRHDVLISMAGKLRSLGKGVDEAVGFMQDWNKMRFNPPEDPAEIERQVRDIYTRYSREFNLTELGLAERFIEQHGHNLLFNHNIGKWLIWNERTWESDEKKTVVELGTQTVRSIYASAENELDSSVRQALVKYAMKCEGYDRIAKMLNLAKSITGVGVLAKDLDSNPYLFNVLNGVYDLEHDKFREHWPGDLITKIAPIVYDPSATSPRWEEFLLKVMDNKRDLVAYLQRLVGYCLSGDVSEQIMPFAYGKGGNGKTLFFETTRMLLGDYWQKAPTEMIMFKSYDNIPADMARLQGARFVVASEIPEGRRLNEVRVKDLTGGDRIVARYMRENFFEFEPTHKLWIYGNHKPIIKGTDDGIWRRIPLIPFSVKIPPSERIPLSEMLRVFREELPGILNWALDGWRDYRSNHGLDAPKEVVDASQGYREEMDSIGDFIIDRCEAGPNRSVSVKRMYEAYHLWAEESGEPVSSKRAFNMALRERDFESKPGTGNVTIWLGIGLRNQTDG